MIHKIPNIFLRDFNRGYTVEVFRRVFYIFLFLNTLSLLPVAHDLWAYNGIIGTRGWDFSIPTWKQGSYALLNVLSHPACIRFPWVYIVFITGQLFFLAMGILRILPKFSSIMVYFFTTNLFLKGFLMFTGGEVLASLLLFYLMFIHAGESKFSLRPRVRILRDEYSSGSELRNVVNNTFFILLLIQICILYFFSTFYKLLDENWVSGKAVMYISRIDAFSSKPFHALFSDNYFLSAIATYLVLIYQGLFGVIVWFKKIKIPFLLFGVFFHLGIAFGMGVFTFGIIMCLVYLLFLTEGQIDRLRRFFSFRRTD